MASGAEGSENAIGVGPAQRTVRHRFALIAVGSVSSLVILSCFLSLALLNSDWLRDTLVAKASESLHADLRLADVEFSPFRGTARLQGLDLERHSVDADLRVRIESAELDLCWPCLIVRELRIKRLELQSPRVAAVRRRPAEAPVGDTADKLRRWVDKRLTPPRRAEERAPVAWEVRRLLVHDGVVEYRSAREGEEPFDLRADAVEYAASNVSLSSLYRLLYGADMSGDITLGTVATLDKRGSATPATCTLDGVNMAALDRLLDQDDALVVAGGTMDLRYALAGATDAMVQVTLSGLELERNAEAANQEFLFVPVERVVDYVANQEGQIELSFALTSEAFQRSDDLDALAGEFWKGLWIGILKQVSPGSVDELVEQGKAKARGLMDRYRDRGAEQGPGSVPAGKDP